jgi:NADH-quinone oxidoreductase subunit L
MTVPLVALAIGSIVAGALNLPFGGRVKTLENWLEPVVGAGEVHVDVATGVKIALVALATIGSLVGIAAGVQFYLRRRFEDRPADPEILERGWYYDQAISDFAGGPGREGFEGVAWTDANVVDGGVNGVGWLVRVAGGGLRRLQNGYVRSYALAMALGAVILVAAITIRSSVL